MLLPMPETVVPPTPLPPPPPTPDTFERVATQLGPAGVLGVAWAVLPPLGSIALFRWMNTIGEWLRGHDGQGVSMYIAGFAVLAGAGLLPTYATAVLGGWAFGFAVGFPAAMAGFLAASLIGHVIARFVAMPRVQAMIETRPKWLAVRDALVGGSALKTLGIITLVRLPPNSPFALTNMVLTSVRVPLWTYVLGTLVGMAPRTGAVVYVATQLRDMVATEAAGAAKPRWMIITGIVLAVVVMVVIGSIANKALKRFTQPRAGTTGGRTDGPG